MESYQKTELIMMLLILSVTLTILLLSTTIFYSFFCDLCIFYDKLETAFFILCCGLALALILHGFPFKFDFRRYKTLIFKKIEKSDDMDNFNDDDDLTGYG